MHRRLAASLAEFSVRALIILTLLFERNMYRYREPRTFVPYTSMSDTLAPSLNIWQPAWESNVTPVTG